MAKPCTPWHARAEAHAEGASRGSPRNAVSRRYQSDASAMKRAMSGPLIAGQPGAAPGADAAGDASESGDNDDDIDAHDPGDDPEARLAPPLCERKPCGRPSNTGAWR